MTHPEIADGAGPSDGMPSGPWLAVVGMHRSGTSAVTGALAALGFQAPRPDDRMDWPESNPEHWESSSLTVYNDALLADLGGSWEAPPDLAPHWEDDPARRAAPNPTAVARTAFPDAGPLVWKDPRLCLLLPFWLRLVPPPLATVLVWRSPLSVARSLQQRDGMHLASGIALWDRYNRSALQHLVGLDVYVCNYESVVDDPESAMGTMAEWLSSLPQFDAHARDWDPARAAAMIAAEAGTNSPDSGDELLLTEQQELVATLAAAAGGHRPLAPVALAEESGWTTALLAARRESRSREVEGLEAQVKWKQAEIDRLHHSTSWRITAPLRTLTAVLPRGARRRG
ncbi:MAG: sulfotransferase family protein [Acidimicrobiales bacterium]